MKTLKYILCTIFFILVIVAEIIVIAKIVSYLNTETIIVEEIVEEEKPICPNTVEELCSPIEEIVEEQTVETIVYISTLCVETIYSETEIFQTTEDVITSETIEETTFAEEEIDKPYFTVTEHDRNTLIHLLFFEACSGKTNEDVKEQKAIISVVFNRFTSGDYKGCYDIEDIVKYQYPSGAYAFSPAKDWNRFWKFKDENEKKDFERNYKQLAEKVDYVIQNGPTVPTDVKYFVSNECYRTSTYFKNNHKIYAVYDDTTFMTDEKP